MADRISAIQAAAPGLRTQGLTLMALASTTMNQQSAWATQQVETLLRSQSAAVQNEAMALIQRFCSANSTVGRGLFKPACDIETSMEQTTAGLEQRLAGYLHDDMGYDPTRFTNILAGYEGQMLALFDAFPVLTADNDNLWTGITDGSDGTPEGLAQLDRFNQSVEGIAVMLENFGYQSERTVQNFYQPTISSLQALAASLEAFGNRQALAAENLVAAPAAGVENEITSGPLGTDAFQAHLAAFEASVGNQVGTLDEQAAENQVTTLIASVTALENALRPLVDGLDVAAPAGTGPMPRGIASCTPTTTNTINGGAGTDFLIGTGANDHIICGGGTDFAFGLGVARSFF